MKTEKNLIRGFTIVELIIVIVVIGILASIVMVTYNGMQQKTRDTRRMSDLQSISDAIRSYHTNTGNDVQGGSGCGGGGNGDGWFNFSDGGSYPASINSCLTTSGYLDATYSDPSGCTAATGACVGKGVYMKYSCGTGDAAITYLYARLEASGNTQDLVTANICSSATVATNYGMNYMLVVK